MKEQWGKSYLKTMLIKVNDKKRMLKWMAIR